MTEPRKQTCRACGLGYVPDPRNAFHQECCTRQACVRRRKRERQRLWHRRQYEADPSFREAAKARVRRHRQRVVQPRAQGPPPTHVVDARLRHVEHALLGLAAQMGEEPDAVRAWELVSAWADAGSRRVADLSWGP